MMLHGRQMERRYLSVKAILKAKAGQDYACSILQIGQTTRLGRILHLVCLLISPQTANRSFMAEVTTKLMEER